MTQPSLVERLNEAARLIDDRQQIALSYKSSDAIRDAAQAIERLEGEVARLKRQVVLAVEGAQPLWSGEVEALRSLLDEAVGALEANAKSLLQIGGTPPMTDRMEEVRAELAAIARLILRPPLDDVELAEGVAVRAANGIKALLASEERMREALGMALAWIDAVPLDTPLPGMPGFDRDWVNAIYSRSALEGEE